MTFLRLVLLITLVTPIAMSQQSSHQQPSAQRRFVLPASCPVTVPPVDPFIPPSPYELDENSFWLGTERMWTVLRKSGIWEWAPRGPGREHHVYPLTEKIWWMSLDYNYNWKTKPYPEVKVTGRRLDGFAPPLLTTAAWNAFPGPAPAMVTGVYIPTPGCWEITGEYDGYKLSFVVWVKPVRQGNQ